MELLQLRYFRTAAKLQNFSKAAALHLVPQPAISKTILKLEEELGCPLFTRQGKKVVLNEAGQAFLTAVDQALSALDEGVRQVSALLPPIALYPQAGIRFLPQLTTDYWMESGCQLKTMSYQDVVTMGKPYDLTLMHLLPDMSPFSYRILMEDTLCVAVSPAHALADRLQISIRELTQVPLIGFDSKNPLRTLTDAFFAEYQVTCHYAYVTPDPSLFRSMISRNAGAGIVPSVSWRQTPSDTVLIPLAEHKARVLVLAWPVDKKLSPQEQSFCSFAEKWFQNKLD